MKTVLALSAASAALMLTASAANAQDCVNGYKELGNGVILTCDEKMSSFTQQDEILPGEGSTEESAEMVDAAVPEEAFVAAGEAAMEAPEEPLFTGSIATAETPEQSPLEASEQAVAWSGGPECVNGYRELGNGVILTCESEPGSFAQQITAPVADLGAAMTEQTAPAQGASGGSAY
jgi:hypothetical protein